jgi:hypothetical protein
MIASTRARASVAVGRFFAGGTVTGGCAHPGVSGAESFVVAGSVGSHGAESTPVETPDEIQ